MLNRSKSLCQYFNTKSGCKFKENCRFLHSPTSISSPAVEENQENGTSVNQQVNTDSLSGSVSQLSFNNQNHEAVSKETKPCFTFEKYGSCRFGNNCRYLHSLPKELHLKKPNSTKKSKTDRKSNNDSKNLGHRQQTHEKRRVCHYYQAGFCQKGNNCRFHHPDGLDQVANLDVVLREDKEQAEKRDADIENVTSAGQSNDKKDQNRKFTPKVGQKKIVPRPVQPVKEFQREGLLKKEVENLRSTEIEQLKKRLAASNLEVITDSEDSFCVQFDFSSSDPDWPYDVEVFNLKVTIPKEYPLKMFVVRLSGEQNLPETVQRYIDISLEDWINTKQAELISVGTVRLEFRPFMKWLDKNLESIVTGALKQLKKELDAKAAGLQFIPASKLQEKVKAAGSDEDQEEGEEEEGEDENKMFGGIVYRKTEDDFIYTGPQQQSDESESEDDDLIDSAISDKKPERDERRGTEIKLRNLTLKDNASTLTCGTLKVIIQCARCKNKMDVSTPSGRPNLVTCGKCSYPQVMTFRSAIMHQFSSVVGYLDLDGCIPFDLILQDCMFKLGCFSCNKEMKAKSMAFGQVTETWCSNCHSKMKVSAESVRFAQLLPSEQDLVSEERGLHKVPVLKPKKNLKEPEIQLGYPLPKDGTCKHYKKSYRWFRFPCCGKCYPCDVCHEEKEGGHEMVLATRMICGHCCREQPFALDKACVGCKQSMTQVRTTHWEGGKGCRDKSKMSKNDAQKYAGQSKTVSRKAQDKQKSSTAKKNIKLRHSSH